jgi:hypothetical protein
MATHLNWALPGRDPTKVAGQAFQMGPKGPMRLAHTRIRVSGALGLALPSLAADPWETWWRGKLAPHPPI